MTNFRGQWYSNRPVPFEVSILIQDTKQYNWYIQQFYRKKQKVEKRNNKTTGRSKQKKKTKTLLQDAEMLWHQPAIFICIHTIHTKSPTYGTQERRKTIAWRLPICSFYSHASFVSNAAQQMAKAWNAEQRVSIIHRKHILPNLTKLQDDLVRIRLGGWDGGTPPPVTASVAAAAAAATSWKFLTEATVTLPRKLRHQHCNCSCHLGALFRRTKARPSILPLPQVGPRSQRTESYWILLSCQLLSTTRYYGMSLRGNGEGAQARLGQSHLAWGLRRG